jgi:hypothetical protein
VQTPIRHQDDYGFRAAANELEALRTRHHDLAEKMLLRFLD